MRLPCFDLVKVCFGALLVAGSATAAEPQPIEVVPVAPGIDMLMGYGGNVVLSTGDDGAFLIDDQYPEQREPLAAAIARVTDAPVRLVVNTHWHNDHTGGNEALGARGAVIVAHDNVRQRLSSAQTIAFFKARREPAPPAALPVVTFSEAVALHLNGQDIDVLHVANAHTDGDAVVVFRQANVIHTGDVFFNGLYPFIDAGNGGSVAGMLAACDRILSLADAHTRIIPGHGPIADRNDLAQFRAMLHATYHAVAELMITGLDRGQLIDARPTAVFDPLWGNGFLKPDTYVRMLHDAITRATLP